MKSYEFFEPSYVNSLISHGKIVDALIELRIKETIQDLSSEQEIYDFLIKNDQPNYTTKVLNSHFPQYLNNYLKLLMLQ